MKKQMKTWLIALSLAVPTFVAGSAMAHGGGGGHRDPAQLVQKFDANKNGKLEMGEIPEKMRNHVQAADTNKDGAITVDELKAYGAAKKQEFLAKYDTNKDGKLDDGEKKVAHAAKAKEHFARMDKDNNGALTQAEVGDKKWSRLSVADADKNGSVTQAEIEQAHAAGKLGHGHRGK